MIRHGAILIESYRVVLNAFAEYLFAKGLTPGTQQQMIACCCEFLEHCQQNGNKDLDAITPVIIQQYFDVLRVRPKSHGTGSLSPAMVQHHLKALRVFFNWLLLLHAIVYNPIASISLHSGGYRERLALSLVQINALFEACESALDNVLLALFYGCGLRRMEACQLHCTDIDVQSAKLLVRCGKFKKRRIVPMSVGVTGKVKDYLAEYHGKSGKTSGPANFNGFFLRCKTGERMSENAVYARIKYLGEKAGIERPAITPHHLRHSIATHLLEQGMEFDLVMRFLGHATPDVTQRYTKGYNMQWQWNQRTRKRSGWQDPFAPED